MDPIDRVPPHGAEVERAVIGACLLDQAVIDAVVGLLGPEAFYLTAHRHIWGAIGRLHQAGSLVDQITIYQELTRDGHLEEVGGAFEIARLVGNVGTSVNVEYHAGILVQLHHRRRVLERASQLVARCYDPSVDEADLVLEVEDHPGVAAAGAWESGASSVAEVYDQVGAAMDLGGKMGGVTTGLSDLDEMLDGLHPGDFVVIASRPSMGKSALAVNIAWAASHHVGVGIVPVEMSVSAMSTRILSLVSGLDSHALRRGRITGEEYRSLAGIAAQVAQRPIRLSQSLRDPWHIYREVRRLKDQHGIGLLVVDYLQLLDPADSNNDTREQEVAGISRMLKKTAQDLEIAVVAMAQINRKSEARGDKKPMLSDLRESGQIEADADVVILLHRPAYYGVVEVDDVDVSNLMEAHVAKQRNGPTGLVNLYFNSKTGKIATWEDRYGDRPF